MASISYSEATTEVLLILAHTKKEKVNKIPRKFINFLIQNSSKTYKPNFDYKKPINELNLKPKSQALLGIIYLKYWADEDGKEKFNKKIEENEQKYQYKLKEKYSTDLLFKNKETIVQPKNIKKDISLPIVQNKSLIQKVLEKIKRMFKLGE